MSQLRARADSSPGGHLPSTEKFREAVDGVRKVDRKAVQEFCKPPPTPAKCLFDRLLMVLGTVKNTQTISVIVYQSGITLNDLINGDSIEIPWSSPAFTSLGAVLQYDGTDETWYGASKLAFKAEISVTLPRMQTTSVCLKQVFYKKTRRGEPRKVVDTERQLQELALELSCLHWGRCLLELVYTFIAKKKEFPYGPIPQFRFVEGGLAISTLKDHVFLVEEWIPASEGWFLKYINNSSAAPLFEHLPQEYRYNARFLAFAQHVQYVKTGGIAYISDFQGELETLYAAFLCRPDLS